MFAPAFKRNPTCAMIGKPRDEVRLAARVSLEHCLKAEWDRGRLGDCLGALRSLGWCEASIAEVERIVSRVLRRNQIEIRQPERKLAS